MKRKREKFSTDYSGVCIYPIALICPSLCPRQIWATSAQYTSLRTKHYTILILVLIAPGKSPKGQSSVHILYLIIKKTSTGLYFVCDKVKNNFKECVEPL